MEYNFKLRNAFKLYNLAWRAAIPLLRLNSRLADGWEQRISGEKLTSADLWIQAASAGESYIAQQILNNLRTSHSVKVLLTTNTAQGMEILKLSIEDIGKRDSNICAEATYFPFDSPLVMEEAVRRVRPKAMILLEMEIWPGLIKALKEHGCEIFIINGRITEKSLKKYMKFPWLWNYLTPDNILAITKEDAERFRQLFATSHIDIMPNIKFDRISFNARPESKIAPLENFINDNNPFVVLASVRQEEEGDVEKIIKHIKAVYPSIVIGLFPRHKHRIRAWKELLRKKGCTWELRSKVKSRVAGGTVILWDIFGELTAAYSIASSAFVGGSLRPLGGQNFLEAVSCGIVPVIGPHWNDFFWVGEEIFELGLAKQASGWKEVANIIVQSLNNLPFRDKTLKKCLMYIKERQGGADMACRLIEDIL